MFCANRLAIGTANWGKEYNGVKVSEAEQSKILAFCREVGIDMLDWSTIYGCLPRDISPFFNKVIKYHPRGNWCLSRPAIVNFMPYCLMAHGAEFFYTTYQQGKEKADDYIGRYGASIYDPFDMKRLPLHLVDVLQVPYSLFDRRFESYLPELKKQGKEIHVRSIFLRGRILGKATPHDCITFCLMNPNVDRVIMGVDSLEQLESNLSELMKMDSLKVTDEKVLDPRQW